MEVHDFVFDSIVGLSDMALESNMPKLAKVLEDSLDVWLEERRLISVPQGEFRTSRSKNDKSTNLGAKRRVLRRPLVLEKR